MTKAVHLHSEKDSEEQSIHWGLKGVKARGIERALPLLGVLSLSQSSATKDRARSSLSLASFSLCSSLSPAWSIWSVNSLKILCISVKYTTWKKEGKIMVNLLGWKTLRRWGSYGKRAVKVQIRTLPSPPPQSSYSLLTTCRGSWSYSPSPTLMRSHSDVKERARRNQTTKTNPSSSVGSDPAFSLPIWTWDRECSLKAFLTHPTPASSPSSWVRIPGEMLWWLIDFNHITRLQKSGPRMKVLGNTTPWNPHTFQYLFMQRCIRYSAL